MAIVGVHILIFFIVQEYKPIINQLSDIECIKNFFVEKISGLP